VAEDRDQPGAAGSSPPEESPCRVFAYALADRAELYLDVVGALVAAKDRFRLQLRPGDVVRELASAGRQREQDEVLSALEALAQWGNVSRFYDSDGRLREGAQPGNRFRDRETHRAARP
jgi:hypothetical protein